MRYVVRYRNLYAGDALYQGGSGLNVNTGTRDRHRSACRLEDALTFASLATAQRHARACNPSWAGEVITADGSTVVWQTRRMRASRFAQGAR